MPEERLSWDEFFILLLHFYATRGTCDRLRAAAIIASENHKLLSAGYNGSPPSLPHCDDLGHLMVDGHCLRTNHAEENAVLNAGDLSRLHNGTAYILGRPCYPCARRLVSVGIRRMVFVGEYENAEGGDLVSALCRQKGVKLDWVEDFNFAAILQKAINFLQGPGGPFKDLKKRIIIECLLE
jgi:dCMP deaminase